MTGVILSLFSFLSSLRASCAPVELLLAVHFTRLRAVAGMSVATRKRSAAAAATVWGGGRWSAVYSLWTYAHRLLHLVGFTAVDREEVALLSAPLVRVRTADERRVLAHVPDPRAPSEPLGLVRDADSPPLEQTLFLLHFVPTDTSASVAEANCARLATAFPTETSPRAWIAVDEKTGYLSLTAAEANAAVFEVRAAAAAASANGAAKRGADVSLVFHCAAGSFLSMATPQTNRVRVCSSVAGRREIFRINAMPRAPCDDPAGGCAGDPNQATLAAAIEHTRELPVRLQSAAYNWFLASSPGAALSAASRKETGWDAFIIEFDHATSMARIRDSRGLYLILGPDLKTFKAGVTSDDAARAAAVLSSHSFSTPMSSSHALRKGAPNRPATTVVPNGAVSKATAVPIQRRPRNPAETLTGKLEERQVEALAEPRGAPQATEGNADVDDESVEVRFADELPRAERFVVTLRDGHDRVTLRSRKGYLGAGPNGKVRVSQNTTPGRREQFYLRVALPSMMDQSSPSLRLRHYAQGLREVDASIVIPASAAVTYGVLCDYDGFHRFISDCSESALLAHNEDGTLVVRMCQAHSFLVLTISMSMTLRVEEIAEERKVRMDLMQGMGVKAYKGVWHATERPDGRCALRVKISSAPAVPAPNFLVDGVMTHAVTATLEQIRSECILRSSGLSDT